MPAGDEVRQHAQAIANLRGDQLRMNTGTLIGAALPWQDFAHVIQAGREHHVVDVTNERMPGHVLACPDRRMPLQIIAMTIDEEPIRRQLLAVIGPGTRHMQRDRQFRLAARQRHDLLDRHHFHEQARIGLRQHRQTVGKKEIAETFQRRETHDT